MEIGVRLALRASQDQKAVNKFDCSKNLPCRPGPEPRLAGIVAGLGMIFRPHRAWLEPAHLRPGVHRAVTSQGNITWLGTIVSSALRWALESRVKTRVSYPGARPPLPPGGSELAWTV